MIDANSIPEITDEQKKFVLMQADIADYLINQWTCYCIVKWAAIQDQGPLEFIPMIHSMVLSKKECDLRHGDGLSKTEYELSLVPIKDE